MLCYSVYLSDPDAVPVPWSARLSASKEENFSDRPTMKSRCSSSASFLFWSSCAFSLNSNTFSMFPQNVRTSLATKEAALLLACSSSLSSLRAARRFSRK